MYTGQFLGIGFLVMVSLLFAYLLNFTPAAGLTGLLGLIPIF
ncbi:cadmium resistance transporter [Eremococcus coleocola]